MIVALRLALGREVPRAGDADWTGVLAAAIRERLGGLAWLRSGDVIRAHAPRDVVDRWRTLAVVTHQRGQQRLDALRGVVDAMERNGLEPIVLKGMPLSQQLYGDPFVRTSDDIDLFIHAAERSGAARVLATHGWSLVEGKPPWDELYVAHQPEQTYLEVHESLLNDYLAHRRLAVSETAAVAIDGQTFRALSGSVVPVYLAAHLAGHQLPPLLWGIDFFTLWSALTPAERSDARATAERVRLRGYLEWALAFASSVDRAAEGDRDAAERLGIRGNERADRHMSVVRHARLAGGPIDTVQVIAACAWPRPIRWNVVALAKRIGWGLGYRGRRRDDAAARRAGQVALAAGLGPAHRSATGSVATR